MRKLDLLFFAGVVACCWPSMQSSLASQGATATSQQTLPVAPPKPTEATQTTAGSATVTDPVKADPAKSDAAKPEGKGIPKSPGAAPRTENGSPFVIGSEDVLAIRVWDEPNLSGPVSVGPDGMISLQLIHEVKASGLTPVQLEAAITERLKEFRNNPEVSVSVVAVRSRKYFLQGGFQRTGTFPLTGPTTVMEAIVNGSGFKEFSNRKKIYILRTKPDGTAEKIKFNYDEVRQGKNMKQNILIQNGDYIIAPE